MAVAATQQPVSPQVVGNAFVAQYYQIQRHSPSHVHRFYQDISRLGRPEDDGSMSITTTMEAINEKIMSLKYEECKAEIKSVDAQESLGSSVIVLVTGYLTGTDNVMRSFAQTFFLAPQEKGFFVLNDMLRFMDDADLSVGIQYPVTDVDAPVTPDQQQEPTLVQENHVTEQANTEAEEEDNGEEVYNPSQNEEVSPVDRDISVVEEEVVEEEVMEGEVVEEEVPVAEVLDEVQDDSQMIVAPDIKIEKVPKKSYASIVMDLKGSAVPFSSPPPVPRKSAPKSQVQQADPAPTSASAAEVPLSSSDASFDKNSQEGEAEGPSIYIKGLPYNATPALLEDAFKKFGPIKSNGIQVRSNRLQGFSFGFVEFEVATAVEKAIEASPIQIGGRQAIVEEKRSIRGNYNRGPRIQNGRGYGYRNDGYRNDGPRGRSAEGNRGYNSRGDFGGGRTEFGNRRAALPNRGGDDDGYQRVENSGRYNRTGGMAINATGKNMPPRVPATA